MAKLHLFILFLFCFILGILSTLIYQEVMNYRVINGIWIPYNYNGATTEQEAINVAKTYDTLGNFICVNIKGMDYKQMLETCSHEVGHEIFAQKCAKNIVGCLNWSTN